jgi:hypothetical protein
MLFSPSFIFELIPSILLRIYLKGNYGYVKALAASTSRK